ncbi:MAG: helix-hairpin-helix domain-containing protein [Opitutales bacterium]
MPVGDPGLNLLQRLRDEAHRFANTYNADLRSRKLRESILDDCPGLGPKRKAALLAHFGSIDRLRAASPAEIAAVGGFGEKFAAELHAFLHSPPDPPCRGNRCLSPSTATSGSWNRSNASRPCW